MQYNKNRFLIFVLVITLLSSISISMTGCSKEEKKSNAVDAKQKEAAKDIKKTSTSIYDTKEHIEFRALWNYEWFDTGLPMKETDVGKELGKIMNCNIVYEKPNGPPDEYIDKLIAANSLPEVIVLDRTESYRKLIKTGKVIPLDDYISKYSGYRENVDESTMNFAKVNGKTYSLLNWTTTSDHPTGNAAWAVNTKIYKALGSPTLKTFDDLYNYLTKVKNGNFKYNGKPVTPLQFGAEGVNYGDFFQIYFGYGGTTLPQNDYVYKNGDKLTYMLKDPKFEKTLCYVNKLWQNGLLSKNFLVDNPQQIEDKVNNGGVAVYAGRNGVNELAKARIAWKASDPEGDYTIIEPIGDIETKDIMFTSFSKLGWNSICISSTAEKPERIFQILDFIASNEGQRVTFYGPKGILWDKLDKNSYPIIKKNRSDLSEEELKKLAAERYSMPGMAKWVDLSKVAADNRKPVGERDFVIQAQNNIAWKHSIDLTDMTSLNTIPGTDTGKIFDKIKVFTDESLVKIITAKDESEVSALIKTTIDKAYKDGFGKVEVEKTNLWHANLESMK